jgi:hypothetical protein
MKRFFSLAALLLLGCPSDSDDRSTLTLTITSNLEVPNEIDELTVSVPGEAGGVDPMADLKQRPFPRTLTLVHESGPLGPFTITVYGWSSHERVIQHDELVSFPEHGNTDLTIELDRSCRNIACVPTQTCELGRCVPIAGQDAAVADASTSDARVPDAQVHDAAAHDASGSDAAAVDAQIADAQVADAQVADAGTDAQVVDAAPGAGAPPQCAISLPVTGDAYQVGVPFPLLGTCSDPETGALSDLSWLSSRDGLLGNGAMIDAQLATATSQRVTLCAADPRDATVVGCASADIEATTGAQPSATISSITQGSTSAAPYRSDAAIAFAGVGSGAGVTLSWSDDVQGALANTSLATPFIGKHNITFTVRDRNGVTRSAARAYLVLGPGETSLASPLATVNGELDRAGNLDVPMIASDPLSRAYVPSSSGVLYRFDGNALAESAVVAIGQPPLRDVVRDAQLSGDKTYLATGFGVTVCAYTPAGGAVEPCTNYLPGGLFQSQNFLSVLRMVDSRNVDSLMFGSDNGLFLSDSVNGGNAGRIILRGRTVNDMVQLGGQAALALDNGLTLLTPSNQQTVHFTTAQGLPANNLRALASAADGTLWIATGAGLAHFEPGSNKVTVWSTAQGLPSNNCNGVAVQRVTQLSPARDVVWVATVGGVARLDTFSNDVTSFTTADGLPSNNVLTVHVLANGTKLFGTASGLAHYVGF